MEQSKSIMKPIIYATGAVLISCAILLAVLLVSAMDKHAIGTYELWYSLSVILVAAFGAAYCLLGATKQYGGILLKIYFGLNALSVLLVFAAPLAVGFVSLNIGFAIWFAGFCVLFFANDLGETKSKLIAAAIVIVHLVLVLGWMDISVLPTVAVFSKIARVLINISVLVLIFGKYEDKKLRGSK